MVLKKIRDISETESIRKAIEDLNIKVKGIREQGDKSNIVTYCGTNLEQKAYATQNTYEPIASIKLAKGKYLLTFNLLIKANNAWAYIYFRQGEALITNSGFYMPNSQHFIPFTFRKVFNLEQDTETISFTTYCAQSYPINVRNAIITARKLPK